MRTRIVSIFILILLILAAIPQEAPAIPYVNSLICRGLHFQNTGSGTQVTPLSCGREFSTSVPYVVLFTQVEQLEEATTLAWQLRDPNDEVYARSSYRINIPSVSAYVWTFYDYRILPVAATEKEIVEQNPRFRGGVIEVGATPVSQMPGQWKLSVALGGRSTGTVTFSLKP